MSSLLLDSRTPPVEAALIPVTTPSQPLCAVLTRAHVPLSVCSWLADTDRPRPLRPRPPSPASRPARHRHCLCHRQPCGFNNSIEDSTQLQVSGMAAGQTIDGPSHGAAPLPWDIRCNPTQMFHTEIRNLEVPHTATIAVRIAHAPERCR